MREWRMKKIEKLYKNDNSLPFMVCGWKAIFYPNKGYSRNNERHKWNIGVIQIIKCLPYKTY